MGEGWGDPERSHAALTENSQLLLGHGFALALFPAGRPAVPSAGGSFRLGWQQVLGATGRRRVGARVKPSWDGAGQLGLRFAYVLLLQMLGQAPPALASFPTLLFGSVGVQGGRVGLWGHTCPLEVSGVTLIAGWP